MLTATHPDVDWRHHARCAAPDTNPDLWSDPLGACGHDTAEALHICHTHCPILGRCHQDATHLDPLYRRSIVLGGVAYGTRGQAATTQRTADHCHLCADPVDLAIRDARRESALRRAARRRTTQAVA